MAPAYVRAACAAAAAAAFLAVCCSAGALVATKLARPRPSPHAAPPTPPRRRAAAPRRFAGAAGTSPPLLPPSPSLPSPRGSPRRRRPSAGCNSLACCPTGLYNQGWDGYRLADMLQSRYQRHTAAGAAYHLKHFPRSLVARFLRHYKAPSRPGAAGSDGYERVTRRRCHRGANLSSFPLLTASCAAPGVPPHLQCCAYARPVPALVDLLRREPARRPLRPPAAAVHVRAGEVIELSPCRVEQMLSRYTRFARACRKGGAPVWTGTACMAQPAVEFVMPLPHFARVARAARRRNLSRVVLVAGSALRLVGGFAKSCEYLARVAAFLERQGLAVSFRLGHAPDDDLRFFTRAAAFFPAGGAYSRYAGEVAAAFGVDVLKLSNRSVPPIAEVKHLRRQYLRYIC
ncbi:hypothetical protein AB1Y20_011584 [Prymnesium parvum]|uniref:Uncharacterized protein n=1 Tax=Prymnesium parvum TaxID=97485 RepID=A0AB34IKE9_PRYPA